MLSFYRYPDMPNYAKLYELFDKMLTDAGVTMNEEYTWDKPELPPPPPPKGTKEFEQWAAAQEALLTSTSKK